MTKKGESTIDPGAESVMALYDPGPDADDPVSAEGHEKIAQLAYFYWQARGCHWFTGRGLVSRELCQPNTAAAAA